nr:hypothetical protein [uncultured Hyphomonas sp.]
MKITAEVREYAAGMEEKSREFMEKGGEIYLSESGEKCEPID